MAAIIPGVYIKVIDKIIPPTANLEGTSGLFFILSEKGPDNTLIHLGGNNPIEVFGEPNFDKYGQSLYNLIRFYGVSTNVFTMRVLPTLAESTDAKGNSLVPPTFAHVIIGYIKATKTVKDNNTGKVISEDVKYGLFYKYLDNSASDVNIENGLLTRLGDTIITYQPGTIMYLYNPQLYRHDITFPTGTALKNVAPQVADSAIATELWPGIDIEGSYYNKLAEYVRKNGTTETTDTQTIEYQAEFIPLFTIIGVGRGDWYDRFRITLAPYPRDKQLIANNPPKLYTFHVNMYDATYGMSTEVENYNVGFDPNYKDLSGAATYIGVILNQMSEHLRIFVYGDNMDFARKNTIPENNKLSILDWVLTSFYNNQEGSAITSPDEIIFEPVPYTTRISIGLKFGSFKDLYDEQGNLNVNYFEKALINAVEGLYNYDILNVDVYDIDLVFDAGFGVSVKQAFVDLIHQRKEETFAVLDLPYAASVEAALQVRREQINISEPNCALYAPYVTVYDIYTDKIIWVAPSYHLARIYPLNDYRKGFWYAPAYKNRATLDECRGLAFSAKSDFDKERLYLAQINPIIRKGNDYIVYTALTTYKVHSARQNINVARTVARIKRDLRKALDNLIYENIVPETLKLVEDTVDGILKDYVRVQAISKYTVKVVANEYDIRNKRIRVYVDVIPVFPLEKIEVFLTV